MGSLMQSVNTGKIYRRWPRCLASRRAMGCMSTPISCRTLSVSCLYHDCGWSGDFHRARRRPWSSCRQTNGSHARDDSFARPAPCFGRTDGRQPRDSYRRAGPGSNSKSRRCFSKAECKSGRSPLKRDLSRRRLFSPGDRFRSRWSMVYSREFIAKGGR